MAHVVETTARLGGLEVYTGNWVSASGKRPRPALPRTLGDDAAGGVDVVADCHLDRRGSAVDSPQGEES